MFDHTKVHNTNDINFLITCSQVVDWLR